MKIKTKLIFKEYLKLVFTLYYSKPINMLVSIIGVIMFIGAILYFLGVDIPTDSPPYIVLLLGFLIVVVSPLSTYIGARRAYFSHKNLQETIIYEFKESSLKLIGETFNSEVAWSSIHKVLEFKRWILIYHSKGIANIIPKQSFQGTQLADFKALIKSSGVKTN